MSTNKKESRGGPGRGQGRKPEPGIERTVKMRFLSVAEYAKIIRETTPRQRAEIILASLTALAGDL